MFYVLFVVFMYFLVVLVVLCRFSICCVLMVLYQCFSGFIRFNWCLIVVFRWDVRYIQGFIGFDRGFLGVYNCFIGFLRFHSVFILTFSLFKRS